jgi:glutathione S-transferase
VRLFHQPGSRSTRVLWTLEELGVPYELTLMTRETKATDEHRSRHPLGRVPVLELDDGRTVFESGALCLHLADLHQEVGLVPPVGTTERALVYQWMFFAMAELEMTIFDWVRARRADAPDLEVFARRFAPVATVLRDAVSDAPWLLGETFTVADVLVSGPLGTAYRRGLLDEDGPLRDYVDRAAARPANVRAEAIGRPPA